MNTEGVNTLNRSGRAVAHALRNLNDRVRRFTGDQLFKVLVSMLGLVIVALTLGMGLVLYLEGSLALREFGFLGFVTGSKWDPSVSLQFGAWPFLFGTLATSTAALALSLFPAIGVALFSAEYAPRWLAHIVDNLINLIAAVPSVVIGLWGIFVFIPWIRDTVYEPSHSWIGQHYPDLLGIVGTPMGYGVASATIILALMILPYTVALSRDAIRAVPKEQREACRALGATKWETIRMAVLPYARGGIMAGAILSFGRAIGETMAVAMLIGNKNSLPFSLFGPGATMPSVIINEFREAVGNLHLSSLLAIGFILFLVAITVNLLAAWISRNAIQGGRAI